VHLIRYERLHKNTTRLIFPIIVYFLVIDEKLNCLLGTVPTFFLQITT
jgi:hypothetical protein